jgi:hypothetical protein
MRSTSHDFVVALLTALNENPPFFKAMGHVDPQAKMTHAELKIVGCSQYVDPMFVGIDFKPDRTRGLT